MSKLPSYSEMCNFSNTSHDFGYQAHVGWENTSNFSTMLEYLYSVENLTRLQKEITTSLRGLHPDGKDIIVPVENIMNVISNIFENATRTQVGTPYFRDVSHEMTWKPLINNLYKPFVTCCAHSLKWKPTTKNSQYGIPCTGILTRKVFVRIHPLNYEIVIHSIWHLT